MQIPVIPVDGGSGGSLFCGSVAYRGFVPHIVGDTVSYRELISGFTSDTEDKHPVVVMDVEGLRRRNMSNTLLKRLKIRGSRTWFMTQIETLEDVFDAFNTDADAVLMPLHTVFDDRELDAIIEASDSVIPAIFVKERMTRSFLGRTSVQTALDMLNRKGYSRSIVIDTDGSFGLEQWEMLAERNVSPLSMNIGEEDFLSIGMLSSLRYLP